MVDRKHRGVRSAFGAILAAAVAASAGPAFAERPMNVDDAGTLERGGAKLEFGWSRDDRLRGFDAATGYGPIDNVEVEINAARTRDDAPSPEQKFRGVGAAVKWVPLQQEVGLSAGVKFEWGREHASDDAGLDEDGEGSGLIALLSWGLASGQVIHVNFSRGWVRAGGDTEAENGWGIATAYPLGDRLKLTAEVFGAQHGAPDKAVGVSFKLAEGLAISAAVGRGNDRNFGNAGISWEF